jgi:predicted nucleic acid-binding protein
MFLSAALAGKVDYIVSGDKDLLVLNRVLDLKIVNPRQFLDAVGKKGQT